MSDDKKKTPSESKGKKPTKPAKSRTSNHRTSDEPAFNTVLESDESKKPKTKSVNVKLGISRPSALIMSLLAALLGGAIGWGGPILFGGQAAKNEAVQAQLKQTQSDLAAAKAEQEKLATSLAAIQGTSRNQASSNQSIVQTLATLEDDIQKLREAQPSNSNEALTALEERVSTLSTLTLPASEDGETASIDILDLVERMDAIEESGSSEMAERLNALEAQITDIGTRPVAFPEPDTTPIELPPEEAPRSAEETLNILIDTFPRAKMLQAIEAQKAQAAKKPSWLQRALSRHVKTHDEEVADPVDTLDAAEAALKRGDVSGSLDLINDLNPPVRAVAAEWMGAAKKATKLIEKDL